jgi:hypothetical protein
LRHFIRHPAHIPIEVVPGGGGPREEDRLQDVSAGGLCFGAQHAFPTGSVLRIRIPHIRPAFEAPARVAWCKQHGRSWEIGVSLLCSEDAFRARMVEQLCHIEDYRREVLAREGRALSDEEAALEWIDRHAHDFPPLQRPAQEDEAAPR